MGGLNDFSRGESPEVEVDVELDEADECDRGFVLERLVEVTIGVGAPNASEWPAQGDTRPVMMVGE